jgi:cytochrome c biogenesis protein CcdA/thiol-disulfide isomerase/thioredoxin
MLLLLLAFLGGALTIASPCILPVLPFLFARSAGPFSRNGLPVLVGMALAFSGIASLAAVGGGWVVQANHYGRAAALVLMAFFGFSLLLPRLAERVARPLVTLGGWLTGRAKDNTVGSSLLLGGATGLLWAPCAGPILGTVLTGAALHGPNLETSLLLLAYGAGAAASLAMAMLAGGRMLQSMQVSSHALQGLRWLLGVALLVSVATIATGRDTSTLARWSIDLTGAVEQRLLKFLPTDEGPVEDPSQTTAHLGGATTWLHSPALTPEALRGQVVLVAFWTSTCAACIETLPTAQSWARRFDTDGLVVIGVHVPKFSFEHDLATVERAIAGLGLSFPIAVDNEQVVSASFGRPDPPSWYLIDAKGRLRRADVGVTDLRPTEQALRQLLAERNAQTR